MTQLPEAIEVETAAAPDAVVIWLHGLGADGHDFEPVVSELGLPAGLRLRFVFPHAPVRPVTINMGMPMRAWYDILQMGDGREDAPGIHASQALVEALITRERGRGIAASRVVLAGFSQGGAMALHAGLRHAQSLAGVLALSTYLPLASTLAAERSEANRNTPVFLAHGMHDPMIGIDRARASRAALEALGYPVKWKEYAMAHSVCAVELADIGAWLVRRLASAA